MAKYLEPSFMIIGGVKCGSSSLYRYLNAHPMVLPCKSKEPNYFSFRPWYQIPFSLHRYKKMYPPRNWKGRWEVDWLDLGQDEKMHASQFYKEVDANKKYITGEATATTFFAVKPVLLHYLYPDLKLIMLLRDPVDRYVSQYRMYERFKNEGRQGYNFLPLEAYIEAEIAQHRAGKKTRILHQGLYDKYLNAWSKQFGREKLLLIRTQDLEEVESANREMQRICTFLNLPAHDFSDILGQKFNRASKREIPLKIRQSLENFYEDSLKGLERNFSLSL
ncbi:MAG: sulfotransferase [Bacteroidota bacterium]